MKHPLLTGAFALALTLRSFADSAPVQPSARENIEWCDIWIAHAKEDKLPRVLLIGDSITRGYSSEVDKLLDGKAYVAHLATSAFLSDPMLLQEITLVLDSMKFDVVHFNNGMHGWQHSEEEYRAAFPAFLETIQKHAPNAKLIFATTTPLKVSKPVKPGDPASSDERIAARNAIALEIVQPKGVAIDDLNAAVAGHPEYHSDNVHFQKSGVDIQAKQVAEVIEKALKP